MITCSDQSRLIIGGAVKKCIQMTLTKRCFDTKSSHLLQNAAIFRGFLKCKKKLENIQVCKQSNCLVIKEVLNIIFLSNIILLNFLGRKWRWCELRRMLSCNRSFSHSGIASPGSVVVCCIITLLLMFPLLCCYTRRRYIT